jgi:hypothetical protein
MSNVLAAPAKYGNNNSKGRFVRVMAVIGVALLAGVSCHLDPAGKDHCLTVGDCRKGNACVVESCVPFNPDGAVWAPPLTYMIGLRRSACDANNGTYLAAESMRSAGFMDAPFVVTSDPAFYVVGVNKDTRAVVSLVRSMVANDFWFEVMTIAQTDGPAALRWRDEIAQKLATLPFGCDADIGATTADASILGTGPPAVYYTIGSLPTPTACGGFAACARAARASLSASGMIPGPTDPDRVPVAGASGDSSVAVDCADFGTYALFVVFATSMESPADWAFRIADGMYAAGCS